MICGQVAEDGGNLHEILCMINTVIRYVIEFIDAFENSLSYDVSIVVTF